MKKLIYIFTALLLSFSLTACMPEGMPSEDDSLPAIDIVERSQLLDMVTIDHILSEKDKQVLADMGVTVTMSDFALTADDRAGFTLQFITPGGNSYDYTADAVIDYTMLPDGSFTDVRFYWGGITKAGKNLMITSLYNYVVLPLDGKTKGFVPTDLDFIREKEGYIVHTAYGFGKYAVMYYTPQEAGIAVFDEKGSLISEKTEEIVGLGIVGMFGTHTDNLISDVPFSYRGEFGGEFISDNLFMIDNSWIYEENLMEDFSLYNCSENTVTENVNKYVDSLEIDGITYSVYEIFVSGGGDRNIGYGGLALRKQNGEYTGCVMYDTKGYSYEKQSSGNLSVNNNGSLLYHSQPTGLRFTIDFENNSCEKSYIITEDMLGEKLAQSKDGRYSIYEYGRHFNKNYRVSYRALKDEKAGEIKFLSDYYAKNYTDISLETGFFSNNEMYLMYDYDFEVYNPQNTENGPVFNIGEKFPLGIEGEDGYRKNTLWAVRRDPVDKTFIVVHDHLGPDRWYYTAEQMDGTYFKDTYDVALLDKEGNIIKSFTTEMKVPADTKILNISLSGDILTMENVDSTTGKTIQKATLNISTGKFKKIV